MKNENLERDVVYGFGEEYIVKVKERKTKNELEITCLYPKVQKEIEGMHKSIEKFIKIQKELSEEHCHFSKIKISGLKEYEKDIEQDLEKMIAKKTKDFQKTKKHDKEKEFSTRYALETGAGLFLASYGSFEGLKQIGILNLQELLGVPLQAFMPIPTHPLIPIISLIVSAPLTYFGTRNMNRFFKSRKAKQMKEELKGMIFFKEKMEIV